jgi:hypothetical protein
MRYHLHILSAFVVAACMVAAVPTAAHHSFSAEFDENNCGEYSGTLTSVDWQNPHAYFFIEAKNDGGGVDTLTFLTSSLANMRRGGGRRPPRLLGGLVLGQYRPTAVPEPDTPTTRGRRSHSLPALGQGED